MNKCNTTGDSPLFIRGPEVELISGALEQVRVLLPDSLADVIEFLVTSSREERLGYFEGGVPSPISESVDVLKIKGWVIRVICLV